MCINILLSCMSTQCAWCPKKKTLDPWNWSYSRLWTDSGYWEPPQALCKGCECSSHLGISPAPGRCFQMWKLLSCEVIKGGSYDKNKMDVWEELEENIFRTVLADKDNCLRICTFRYMRICPSKFSLCLSSWATLGPSGWTTQVGYLRSWPEWDVVNAARQRIKGCRKRN